MSRDVEMVPTQEALNWWDHRSVKERDAAVVTNFGHKHLLRRYLEAPYHTLPVPVRLQVRALTHSVKNRVASKEFIL